MLQHLGVLSVQGIPLNILVFWVMLIIAYAKLDSNILFRANRLKKS